MGMVRTHTDGLKRTGSLREGLAAIGADLANLMFGQVFSSILLS
jgi:hypothetical protein